MPYIEPSRRKILDKTIIKLQALLSDEGNNPGDYNYVMSLLIKKWFECRYNYRTIAEITGVLENVKQEFYRRHVLDYEDEKIKLNGDI